MGILKFLFGKYTKSGKYEIALKKKSLINLIQEKVRLCITGNICIVCEDTKIRDFYKNALLDKLKGNSDIILITSNGIKIRCNKDLSFFVFIVTDQAALYGIMRGVRLSVLLFTKGVEYDIKKRVYRELSGCFVPNKCVVETIDIFKIDWKEGQ